MHTKKADQESRPEQLFRETSKVTKENLEMWKRGDQGELGNVEARRSRRTWKCGSEEIKENLEAYMRRPDKESM
ncbi:hypothetical protein Baya_14420 [Bagarius yarrelli]|uniref:Uncharacterized protein n=1 Tax=Bagarius yarrelli TaxID=175774 RepID=A0A556V8X0_BAGYA|nr:hypothetical protein Baya_14420 [Bagarius yarrelli]